MEALPPCQSVKITLPPGSPLRAPMGLAVDELPLDLGGGYRITFALPLPCRTTGLTSVVYEEPRSIEVKPLRRNYLITVRRPRGEPTYLVYPKNVWDIIYTRYIKPLSEGRPPRDPGVLLYGAPGTGKTSMMELMAEMLGLYTVYVTADAILSKWYGESEKALAQKLREAEENQPSILIVDDAEWLVRSRELAGKDVTMVSSIMNVLLPRLQEWKKRGARTIMAVATNMNPSSIDPALLRSGRLGHPIFFPLPDHEAIETILGLYGQGVEPSRLETLKRQLFNYGANMADVVQAVRDLREGMEPQIRGDSGRGYARLYAPHVFTKDVLQQLNEALLRPHTRLAREPEELGFRLTSPHTRLFLPYPEPLGIAFTVSWLASLKAPNILVKDKRYVDEALATAEASRSVLVIPSSITTPQEAKVLNHMAGTGLLFVGEEKPLAQVYEMVGMLGILDARVRREVYKAILLFYNIRPDDEALEHLVSKSEEEAQRILVTLVQTTGGTAERPVELRGEDLAWIAGI